ncbi:HAD domain-containing protein [Aliikangiella coralliicola]|uniref:Uncharacterized protein n=1 Tax=Aliikangiella coralliicola TaxID=2592383 RepID=A0A545UAD2_9GAMM|nr:HAD domain-containing protein [Aliikangiella coralliicola]TQV86434.1 hypothetical protein FLL46_16070 [Aliikangiella coralliicola]
MTQKRLVFLDIDGVLNSMGWKISRSYYSIPGYDPDALQESPPYLLGELDLTPIALLDELLDDTNAQIVISSSWRQIHPGIDWLIELFQLRGARLIPARIIGATPVINSISLLHQRGNEIDSYISTHAFDGKFICIDDCSFHYQPYHKVVETNPGIGFSVIDYQQALDLLNG